MNINDLVTLIKLVQPEQSKQVEPEQSNILSSAIDKYVIVRSRNEGINAGYLKAADQTGCVISEARRIWYHKPKDSNVSWYEGVAKTGLSKDSKISCPVSEKYIIEDYSITVCEDSAKESIKGHESNETS